jgi:uncharacterized protein
LFRHRERRVHPYKDDKILTAWNGLMIAAMAMGSRVLGNEKYGQAAEKAVEFIYSSLIRNDGRLLARYRDGEAAYPAYVDDYACLIWGLIELYEATYKPEHLQMALRFNDDLVSLFWDKENGGLFLYGSDSEQLITRPKEIYDGAMPSGNSIATLNFLRLARLTARSDLEELAQQQLRTFGGNVQRSPRGHAFMLTAFLFSQVKTKEVVIIESKEEQVNKEMLEALRENFRPFTVSLVYSDITNELKTIVPFVEEYKTVDNKTTAYVCENFACQSPVTDSGQFRQMLDS